MGLTVQLYPRPRSRARRRDQGESMIRLRIGVLACAAAWASLPAGLMAEADLPVWEEATGVYKAAISQYQAGKYPQAQGLLEDFVRRFPTHEDVPGAYLKLARCRAVQKDFKGSADALDQVIRRFYGTPDWLVAYAAKLEGAKVLRDEARAAAEAAKKKAAEEAKKQAAQGAQTRQAGLKTPSPATGQGAVEEPEDAGAQHSLEYFNLLEQMVRRCRQLPLSS